MIVFKDKFGRLHARRKETVKDMVVHNDTVVIHFEDTKYWVVEHDNPNALLMKLAWVIADQNVVDIDKEKNI